MTTSNAIPSDLLARLRRGESITSGEMRARGVSLVDGMTVEPQPIEPVLLSEVNGASPPPLWLERLDPQEPTILYGPGGVGKGSLASWWIVQLVRAGKRVLILDYEHHGGEWRRRIEGLGGLDVLDMVSWLAPTAAGLGPIWTHADRLRDWVDVNLIDYVVIDSAVMACGGGDVMKPETPSQYNAALQVLGVPSLTLAHVTKLHDASYPFGSVFWHNLARVTWSLMPKGDETILVCRKANNYLRPSAQSVTMLWHENVLREVTERPAAWSLADRIAEALGGSDGMTPAEIAAALNEGLPKDEHTNRNSVVQALRRGLGKPGCRWTVNGDRYRLRDASQLE